ncbi:probable leucine-rich repeat receptor-like protein kinase At5g63930 [Juglans regia]|uniref:non-specific serine/threonine protein kinase n=1 Tax=Juglans regia TaxID=51240 RepID=A0A6P9ECR1_JUGRE|nr:probable leucine-rich repeat receptor-like protein kinase At5g63930 [Juglans regia]
MADQTTCFLILRFLALLLMSSLSTDAKILNITTDQFALLALKAHISYDPYHILTTNWSSSTSVCNWVGVTCGSRHHRVTALNLSNNGLVGTIPPHIGNLSFLVNLSISNNNFHGSLPNELSHLYRLELLHFRHNEFSGEIPSSLFNSTSSLQQIVLQDNQLWGSIPSSIFKMSTLKLISLAENKFSGPMPSIFFNMSSLQHIDLSNNTRSGTLPPEVGNLTMLIQLYLANNHFEGSLPPSLFKCKQLQYLSLWSNNFKGKLSPEIGNLTKLTFLSLPYNNCEGAIPSEIGNLHNLENFDLGINNFVGTIPLDIFNISTLQYFGLFGNHLLDTLPSVNQLEGSIPISFGGLVSLEVLDLVGNNLSREIPKSLEVLRYLKYLNVSYNKLRGEIPTKGLFVNFPAESFMSNDALCGVIRLNVPPCKEASLGPKKRLNIMIDVAAALEYLHLGYSTPIVYCDLKPSVVLLDGDKVGHVADFGIAKLLSDGISLTQTMTMATIGYMAPEYGYEGIVSTRGDVYSYGILLMETFTKKKPIADMFTGEMNLKRLVNESFSLSILEVIDANLLSNENDYVAMETCLSATMGLALHCCADFPKQRIDIKNVLVRLNKIKLKYLHDHGGR